MFILKDPVASLNLCKQLTEFSMDLSLKCLNCFTAHQPHSGLSAIGSLIFKYPSIRLKATDSNNRILNEDIE